MSVPSPHQTNQNQPHTHTTPKQPPEMLSCTKNVPSLLGVPLWLMRRGRAGFIGICLLLFSFTSVVTGAPMLFFLSRGFLRCACTADGTAAAWLCRGCLARGLCQHGQRRPRRGEQASLGRSWDGGEGCQNAASVVMVTGNLPAHGGQAAPGLSGLRGQAGGRGCGARSQQEPWGGAAGGKGRV